jgi:hypothetical protein
MTANKEAPKMSREEEIGYHKGAINTLVNERNEFLKLINIVETFLKGHMKRLEELGVNINRK